MDTRGKWVITDQGHWTGRFVRLFVWTTDYVGPLAEIREAATISYGLMKFEPPGGQAGTFTACNGCQVWAEPAAAFAAALPLSCPLPDARCLMLAA